MSKVNPHESAFPLADSSAKIEFGIDVRTYIATHIAGHLAAEKSKILKSPTFALAQNDEGVADDVASAAVMIADRLIFALNHTEPDTK